MEWVYRGTAHVFGDDIFGDKAYRHSREKTTMLDSPAELALLAKDCMIGYDPEFPNRAKAGDLLVAGKNFCCGHFHTQFLWSLVGKGVHVIAESVSRSFFRNAINRGYPFLECDDITEHVSTGDELEANFLTGEVRNLTTGKVLKARPISEAVRPILEQGGLLPYLRAELAQAESGKGH